MILLEPLVLAAIRQRNIAFAAFTTSGDRYRVGYPASHQFQHPDTVDAGVRVARACSTPQTASTKTFAKAPKGCKSGLFDRQACYAECAMDDFLERSRAVFEGFWRGGIGHVGLQGMWSDAI